MEEENKVLENKKEEKKKSKKDKVFSSAEVVVLSIMTLIIGFAIGSMLKKNVIVSNGKIISDKYLSEFIKNYEYIVNNYYEE